MWTYYRQSKLSFIPDILLEIGITPSLTIDKPGKVDHEDFLEIKHLINKKACDELTEEEYWKRHGRIQRRWSRRSRTVIARARISNQKLTNKNHGR